RIFFFSSRRRHTRSKRDWSSDVCSSDLKRVFLIVLDSVGIGEAPDAEKYDDLGAHTLGNIAKTTNGLRMPHMGALGLSNIEKVRSEERRVGKECRVQMSQEP